MRSRAALVAGVVAALVAVAVPAALLLRPSSDTAPPALDAAVRAADAKRITHDYAFGINDHTDERVAYPTNPPTNGPHAFTWAQDGDYSGVAPPPTEQVVHALEHGRVVIQYRRGLEQRKLDQLVALYEESPEHVLLLENRTAMPCEVAATAWGQGVLCPKFNARSLDALRAFRDGFRDRGPESVP